LGGTGKGIIVRGLLGKNMRPYLKNLKKKQKAKRIEGVAHVV
jgi:hypothetical protein